jgi:hypothetical protein
VLLLLSQIDAEVEKKPVEQQASAQAIEAQAIEVAIGLRPS